MIYTTYFDNLKNLPENIIPISICGKAPDWYKGLQYKKLAPKYDFFMKWKETHDDEYYVKCYKEQVLNKLDRIKIAMELDNLMFLEALAIDKFNLKSIPTFALVCYEKPADFCHRHLVAEWLKEAGFEVEEWEKM